jgi:hypothetical protein
MSRFSSTPRNPSGPAAAPPRAGQSTIVDSIADFAGASIQNEFDFHLRTTCAAVVALTLPKRFAEGAATPPPNCAQQFLRHGCEARAGRRCPGRR